MISVPIHVRDKELMPLTVERIMQLIDSIWLLEHSALRDMLDSLDPSAEVKLQKLEEHAQRRGLFGLLARHCFTYAGAVEVIREAIKQLPTDDQFEVEQLQLEPTKEIYELALNLIGVEWEEPKQEEDEEDTDPIKLSRVIG